MNKYPEITELIENSKLKFKLTETNTNILTENNIVHHKIRNFTSLDFYIPNVKENKLVIKFYNFPTDTDSKCLASYFSKLEEDSIFGISIGYNLTEAEDILVSNGYTKENNSFLKGVVRITLNPLCKSDIVEAFEVSLKTIYSSNKMY